MLTREEYDYLHRVTMRDDYPGFKREIIESPNGDGALDREKRYAHVAPKYGLRGALEHIYSRAFGLARHVCLELGVPHRFMPDYGSTMRVLYYPPGAGSAPHTDFDLLTLSLYRDRPEGFEYLPDSMMGSALTKARAVSPGVHFGELWTEIMGDGCTPHRVRPLDTEQRSVVFFVMPPHEAVLPSGQAVGAWVKERKDRSRYNA